MNEHESGTSLTLSDFDEICRMCLSQHKEGHPIVGMTIDGIKAIELLSYSVEIDIEEPDKLPQKLCIDCIKELYRIFEYKRQCHSNEVILKSLVMKIDDDIENEAAIELPESFANEPITDLTFFEDNTEDYNAIDNDHIDDDLDDDEVENEEVVNNDVEVVMDEEKNSNKRRKRIHVHKPGVRRCNECFETFESRNQLIKHQKDAQHTLMTRKHPCELCDKYFIKSKMKVHMRSHTNERPFQCHFCSLSFTMRGNLRRHLMTHTGERPHVCKYCGKGFIQRPSLVHHEKLHAGEISSFIKTSEGARREREREPLKFTCEICGRIFRRLNFFKIHLEKHKGTRRMKRSRVVTNQAERSHVCEFCGKGYSNKHFLKSHQQIHGPKKYLCSECGKGFTTRGGLDSHLRLHTGEKPYSCSICHKRFSHLSSFDSHSLIHSGEKPYRCEHCPKAFTQMTHLTYHSRTHSGEKPYLCSHCGKRFALKGNLTVHIRTHTGETPYLCDVCGKGFHDSSSRKKHRRTIHKGYEELPKESKEQFEFEEHVLSMDEEAHIQAEILNNEIEYDDKDNIMEMHELN